MAVPPTIFPGGVGIKRIKESTVTLLPHPLSPTTPSVVPLFQVERNAVHRMHGPLLGFEAGFESLNIQQ
jgi:hypothetical protein